MRLSEIRKIMDSRFWNMKKVAQEIGLSYYQLRYVIRGKNPPYYNVEKLSDYLENALKSERKETK